MAQLKSSTQERLDGKVSLTEKGAANGVADLDANSEVIKPQAGAAAQTAAGLGAGYRRADGTWAKKATYLGADFPLQTWADNLVSGVVYDVHLSVAQNGLPPGWWYIEVLRHRGDQSNNQFRIIRATSFGVGNSINLVYQSTDNNGTWAPFHQFAINTPLVWNTATMLNGWAVRNYGLLYAKDGNGNVYLTGNIQGGSNTVDTVIANLPAEYGVAHSVYRMQSASGGSVLVYIIGSSVHCFASGAHSGNVTTTLRIGLNYKAGE